MSKISLLYYLISAGLILILQIFTHAQDLDISIRIDAASSTAQIQGKFLGNYRPAELQNLHFRKRAIGNDALGERIVYLKLTSGDKDINARRLMPGEFFAESTYTDWHYTVDLKPSENRLSAAHSSWIADGSGILMLDDILPLFRSNGQPASARIRIGPPTGWTSVSSDGADMEGSVNVRNIERSVIFIGKDLRTVNAGKGPGQIDLTISGSWLFTDETMSEMASEIYESYSHKFGPLAGVKPRIAMLKFPGREGHGIWEAETRGATVTILSSDMPFKSQSEQRLHEQLRHELFHLWFPNGVKLSGDYAWFYEGFALYESLKLGVSLNRIRFDDLLDTLSRAHTIDSGQRPRKPLVGTDPIGGVYARGMLIAFLTDVEILGSSKGKRDTSLLLKNLFEANSRSTVEADANAAIVGRIVSEEMSRRYVRGTELVDWSEILGKIGIISSHDGRATRLSVAPKLNGLQKEILNRLGYNNWRKLGNKR